MVAGIKELKAKLSSYIDQVRLGKVVYITEHGEEVAVIVPLSDEYLMVRHLARAGKAQWSKGKPVGLEKRVTVKGKPLSATILEERE